MFRNKGFSRQQAFGFGVVVFSLFMDMFLYSMIIPIVPTYVHELGASDSMIGLLFSIYALGMMVATPIFGMISDRIGRKRPMIWGTAGLMVSTLLFAFSNSMTCLMIARFLQGVAGAAPWTAGLALLADIFPANKRGQVMGLAVSGLSAGTLLGAPLGGILYDWGGHYLPFLVVTVLTFFNLLATFFGVEEPSRNTASIVKVGNQGEVKLGQYLKSTPIILVSAIVLMAESVLTMIEPLYPPYLERTFSLSASTVGLIFGISTVGYSIASVISGRLTDRYNPQMNMVIGLIILALSLPFLMLADTITEVCIAMFFFGSSIGYTVTPTLPTLSIIVERKGSASYATVYAIFNLVVGIGILVGPIIGGVFSDTIGLSYAFYTMSGVTVLFILLVKPLLNKYKAAWERIELSQKREKEKVSVPTGALKSSLLKQPLQNVAPEKFE
ncbi:MFS transporter [Rubeoparvulum massiliense]|uniref:MFS transporter n=1 Tax=Rubeoparvulum massiliense TaxID=1631346 RepID=UPI00065E8B23|nr:MFS transporter [Rubeoparvulum massiliense]